MATLAGTVYVAFVVDIFSRLFTGWAAARHKRAKLVLDALDMALWHRDHGGHRVSAGLIHHSDYAEPCVKPRKREVACAGGAC